MEDVLAVYRLAHDPRFPVICMDESSKLSGDGANPATCGHLKPGHRGGIGGWYLVE